MTPPPHLAPEVGLTTKLQAPSGVVVEATSAREVLDLRSKGYSLYTHEDDKSALALDFESQLIAEWDSLETPDFDVDYFALGGGEDEE